jgi:CheY-like chemotaxis protein
MKPVDLQDLHVLAVDDNTTNRSILHRMLENLGCRISTAGRGQEALTDLLAASQAGDPYRLVLLDMQMPEMDGEQTLHAIKADPRIRDVEVVILTSMGQRGDAGRLEAEGCSGYLVKPVKQSQLYEIMVTVLGRQNLPKTSQLTQLVTVTPCWNKDARACTSCWRRQPGTRSWAWCCCRRPASRWTWSKTLAGAPGGEEAELQRDIDGRADARLDGLEVPA